MLLNLEQVTMDYGRAEAIKDATIKVAEGSVVSIIGTKRWSIY
jgi:ABC-type branched-subunit amino acid transport system ATPase component